MIRKKGGLPFPFSFLVGGEPVSGGPVPDARSVTISGEGLQISGYGKDDVLAILVVLKDQAGDAFHSVPDAPREGGYA
jgi:hypothetical protein